MLAERGQAMTAKRAAIRCGLAIGRAAYRPPWRRGKFRRHRSILPRGGSTDPPSARAVGLAGVLLTAGVGVALARAERERRAARSAARARNASLLVGEPLAEGLRRVALGQIELAVELLENDSRAGGELGAKTVHETRKAIKRLRALMRVLRPALGKRVYARENAALRDCARRFAGARDAEVMVATLDELLRHHPKLSATQTQPASGLHALRAELVAERDAVANGGAGDAAPFAVGAPRPFDAGGAAAGDLRAIGARVAAWELREPSRKPAALVAPGIERIYRQGRRRMRRARRRHSDAAAMHEWRKSVKDLRYVAETLDRGKPARQTKAGARLHRVARRADRLGEVLGEDHDLVLLEVRVRERRGHFRADRRTRKLLLKAIEQRHKRLRKRALREGARLYRRRKPRAFVRRVRGALR